MARINKKNILILFDKNAYNMEEVIIKNKQKYLKENYLFGTAPDLTDKKRCIHCDTIFVVSDYKVFKDKKGNKFICCPNAPNCDGTVIDWFTAD